MQQQRDQALAHLAAARKLQDQVDGLLAIAVHTLVVDGGYEEHNSTDVGAAVREEIATLEELIKDYVN